MYDAEHLTKRVSPVSRNYTNQNRLLSVRGLKVGRRGVGSRWAEGKRGACVLRRQSIMEGGRCEFWPLSRLTYKMYSVAGSLLKCHSASFCLSREYDYRHGQLLDCCAFDFECDSRTTSDPIEPPSEGGRAHPYLS